MDFKHLLFSFAEILNQMSPYILLGFIIAGLLHVFVRRSTMARHLSGGGWRPVVKAALFGIPLPLCSCGVLPTAVGLRRQGASKASAVSFLIATPQTGVDSIAATYSLLGLPFAILRPIAALVGAVAGGVAVGHGTKEEAIELIDTKDDETIPRGFFAKIAEAVRYGLVDMVASVGKWLVIGLVVAALITVFVPDSFFVGLSRYPLLAMLAVLVVAIPMYICATGSIPIALSLMLKGLSPGIAFVMLMAGPAANFASVMILNRSIGRKATYIYIASVAITAIAFGLLIDLLLPSSWFLPTGATGDVCAHHAFAVFPTICSVILAGLLVYAAIKSKKHSHNHLTDMSHTYTIKGMNCPHCRAAVEKAISAVDGVEEVEVSLSKGVATVSGHEDAEKVAEAVKLAGFECEIN